MPWLFAIDWSLLSLQKLPTNPNKSYFEYSKSFMKAFIDKLHTWNPYEYVSMLSKTDKNRIEFSQFLNSRTKDLKIVEKCPSPTDPFCLQNSFTDVVIQSIQNAYSKCTSCQHIRLFVLTDGFSDFLESVDVEVNISEAIKNEVTCIVVNHSGSQIPSRLNPLKQVFKHFSVETNEKLIDVNEVMDLVPKLSYCEVNSTAILCVGNLAASVSLAPSPCIRFWKDLNFSSDQLTQFYLEVFGFLQVNDMGHPPIVSRYTLVHSPETDSNGGDVLKVLLESLKTTHTAAMANIYIQRKVNGVSLTAQDRQFVTHGFISDVRGTELYVSFFGEESRAVNWLGPFEFLASSSDFGDHEVYNTEKKITPFPVGSFERPSYILPSNTSTIGTEFQYLSWLNNPNGAFSDVNKIFRLWKKLPEKVDYFLKELNRVMSLAEVLGWTELTHAVQSLLPTYLPQDTDAEILKKVYQTARIRSA